MDLMSFLTTCQNLAIIFLAFVCGFVSFFFSLNIYILFITPKPHNKCTTAAETSNSIPVIGNISNNKNKT